MNTRIAEEIRVVVENDPSSTLRLISDDLRSRGLCASTSTIENIYKDWTLLENASR